VRHNETRRVHCTCLTAAARRRYNPAWRVADPICTFLFSLLVLLTTRRIIKQVRQSLRAASPSLVSVPHVRSQCIAVLMESVPEHVDLDKVEEVRLRVRAREAALTHVR
jgi:Co/Zn/Cd efflux system component